MNGSGYGLFANHLLIQAAHIERARHHLAGLDFLPMPEAPRVMLPESEQLPELDTQAE